MNIPIVDFTGMKFVEADGRLSDVAQNFMNFLVQTLLKNAGPEGLVVPNLSSANNSVNPPVTGGQIQVVQNSFNPNGSGVQYGTLVFDTSTATSPNGQLKVFLLDKTFHAIMTF